MSTAILSDLRALTVRQPWASAFFNGPRPKDIENRSRPCPRDLVGQRLWIHAGLKLEPEGVAFCRGLGLELPGELPHAAILGSVLVVACVEQHGSPRRVPFMRFGWVVADPRALPQPVPCVGRGVALGWRIPADVAAKLA